MEQQEGFFQELKQIYDIKIPIPKPSVIQQEHPQKFLFYFDLTNTQRYSNEMSKLAINNSKERQWKGGQIFQFQFNNQKREQQSIFCYYFNNLLQDDEQQININNLLRFRMFFQEFIKTQNNIQIKFVFHFLRKNQNDKQFEDLIINCIYQILDGSFEKLSDIICVYNRENEEDMNYCKISSKKIHFNKSKLQDKIDISYIILLDEFLNYFQNKLGVPNWIGFICYKYVQSQVDVVLKEFEKELLQLYKDILLMIEFPVNLNNQIDSNQNVSQYLDKLKTLISDICIILNEQNFYDMALQFKKVIHINREKMIQYLNTIVKENTEFEIYLKINQKDKQPNQVFNQLLQFQFQLHKSDIEILEKLKMYQYNEDVIKKTLFRIKLDINQQFKQFDLYLPQSLAYVKRIIPQQQNINLDKPHVFVFGMARVGKSTFLNIVNDPENIIITQHKKFDVKVKNNKILLSHSNGSQTFQTENLEIGDFIFVDTPGLHDTYYINRGINHFNIFNSITRVSQQIILLMIDGEQLQTTKNDLIDSITIINNMLGKQKDEHLENFIIPVFTKIRNASTIEEIIIKWQTETMKDITDQKQLKILNIIKKALDQENYIKIYQAECYEIHEEVQQLESEIKKLEAQYIDLDEEKVEDRQALKAQIKLKRQKLKDLRQENLFLKKIQNIREDVLEKCQNLLQRREEILQENQDIVLNFEFQLTPELKQHIDKLLPHRTKFYQHHLTIITNNLIATMLFDDSISINDKVSELYKLNNMKIDRISDIPGNLISCEIQNQIKELDCIKNIMKISDETMDPQKVDFKYFLTQCRILFEPITDSASIHHEGTEILYYSWKKLGDIKKIGWLIPTVFVACYLIPAISISAVCELVRKSVFVSDIENEKQEKLKFLKIQKNYETLVKIGSR
ncbi:unnamed protein product [Paramecium octaurelia]|uniref:G domain-containing protein n=1 Tax=Paramecium octaurelia TaxID=43137 RepID=A0A8S1XPF6_PAROT|nr:unnamed protein product [Paramecium octaurelia]